MTSKKELVGTRIKGLKVARGMTQERLAAEVMDINAKYLSNNEQPISSCESGTGFFQRELLSTAWAAASRAIGTLKGEQDT